ncbi:MAG: hypothetical protein WCJ69_02570 [Betaproteobacteria bacterium]
MNRSAGGCLFLCLVSGAASAATDYASIVPGQCIHDMGEWGENAVHECIRSNLPAARALQDYPPAAEPVIAACVSKVGRRGWDPVKDCVDRALSADGSSR